MNCEKYIGLDVLMPARGASFGGAQELLQLESPPFNSLFHTPILLDLAFGETSPAILPEAHRRKSAEGSSFC